MHDFVVPAIAVLAMAGFTIWYGRNIRKEEKALRRRLEILNRLLSDEGTHNRIGDWASADSREGPVRAIWRDWDVTLAHSPRTDTVYRTMAAEDVFTPERLIPGISQHRGLLAAPSIFTGLGVFFTFIGLAVGFLGLNLNADATTADSIIASAGRLVAAAGIAFTASIIGVGLSLVFNLLEKSVERKGVERVQHFQQQINDHYPLLTPEQSLAQIVHSQQQSTEALQELHERIGNRLQEALEQQSVTMQGALTTSITESLTPAINTLVNATTAQSTAVFETLVERFAASFTDLGAQQRSAMDNASERLQTTIDALGAQVASVTEELRDQSVELANQQKEVLESLDQISSALTTSTGHLDKTSDAFAIISERFEAASSALASDLSEATTTLQEVFAKLDQQAHRGSELTDRTNVLAAQIATASQRMLETTSTMGGQLDQFSEVQTGFRQDLEKNAAVLADGLRAHVEQLAQQVATWLGKYSADVEQQIESRMETWNTVSQDYASKMLATAHALNDAIDELPNKSVVSTEEAA